jgi:hypothetical protein
VTEGEGVVEELFVLRGEMEETELASNKAVAVVVFVWEEDVRGIADISSSGTTKEAMLDADFNLLLLSCCKCETEVIEEAEIEFEKEGALCTI